MVVQRVTANNGPKRHYQQAACFQSVCYAREAHKYRNVYNLWDLCMELGIFPREICFVSVSNGPGMLYFLDSTSVQGNVNADSYAPLPLAPALFLR